MQRISKLKNKIWYSGHYRHIALLQRTHKHRNTREDTGNVVKVFFSIQSKKENVRQWQETECSTPICLKSCHRLVFELTKIKFLLVRDSTISKLWNDVPWILETAVLVHWQNMPAGLMSRSSVDKIWQLWNFKRTQKVRQKFVMTQFVLWLCQKNSGFVC